MACALQFRSLIMILATNKGGASTSLTAPPGTSECNDAAKKKEGRVGSLLAVMNVSQSVKRVRANRVSRPAFCSAPVTDAPTALSDRREEVVTVSVGWVT